MKTYSPMHTITTTAKREVQILLLKKGVIVTLVIMLLVMFGMIGFGTWMKNKDDAEESGPAIAAVGIDQQLLDDAGYDARTAADRDEALQLVRDGEVEAAVVAGDKTWEVIEDGVPTASLLTSVSTLSEQHARAETLDNLGLTAAEYDAATPQIEVVPVNLDNADSGDPDDSEEHFARLGTTLIALIIVIFTVTTFASQVGSRVTEEKSSRVVELVLAAVRPLDFLAGKLLGTIVYGFLATALLLAVGMIGVNVSGLVDGLELDWAILPVLLLSWLLAMLFFGGLYAAAGAMVQRTEDLQLSLIHI